jgi:hypothetical protein
VLARFVQHGCKGFNPGHRTRFRPDLDVADAPTGQRPEPRCQILRRADTGGTKKERKCLTQPARPGGNITGQSSMNEEIFGRWLEVFGEGPAYFLAGSGARRPRMRQMARVSLARLSV